MTTCKQCGTALAEGQIVCPNCGADVAPTEVTNENAGAEADATASMMDNDTMPDTPAADGAATNVVAGDPTMATAVGVPNAATSDAGTGNNDAPRALSAASSGGMSAATKAIIAIAVAVVAAGALLLWQVQSRRGQSNISAEDMSEIVKTMLPPQQLAVIAGDEAKRKDLAHQLRQLLGIAEEARAKGFADDPKTKRALESMRTLVLAQSYSQQQREAGKVTTPDQLVPKDEIANFLKEPGQDKKFDEFIEDVQNLGLIPPGQQLADAQKEEIKSNLWAPTQLLARKAIKEGVDKQRRVQLLMRFQESQVLAQKVAPDLLKQVKATDKEVEEYIAKHPELDDKETRTKAEDVLRRARAGEDFAALAKEFSSDPGSKDKGGELGWFSRGQMVKEFEETAFGQQPNQISDLVETPFGFHIIQTEERRTQKADDGAVEDQVRARHILISNPASQKAGQLGQPPSSPRDQAKQAVEKEKRDKVFDEIAERHHITVADNFKVEIPPQRPPTAGMPGGAMGGGGAPGGPDDMGELPGEAPTGGAPSMPPAGSAGSGAAKAPATKPQPKK